jgi:acetyl-CoA synthetase
MTTAQPPESATIENLLTEDRTFPPPADFVANAIVKDPGILERTATEEGFRAFWTEQAERLDWIEPWTDTAALLDELVLSDHFAEFLTLSAYRMLG